MILQEAAESAEVQALFPLFPPVNTFRASLFMVKV